MGVFDDLPSSGVEKSSDNQQINQSVFGDMPSSQTPQQETPQPQEKQSFLGGVASDIANRFTKATENQYTGIPQKIYQAGQVAGVAGDFAGRVLSNVTPDYMKEGFKNTAEFYGKLGQEQLQNLEKKFPGATGFVKNVARMGNDYYDNVKKNHPELVKGIDDALETGVNLSMIYPVGKGGQLAVKGEGALVRKLSDSELGKIARDMKAAHFAKDEATIALKTKEVVRNGLERAGIKPSNPMQADKFYDAGSRAVPLIIEKGGESISKASNPLYSFDKGIRNTLNKIAAEYDDLAKKAGAEGISTQPQIDTLTKFLDQNSEMFKTMSVHEPELVKDLKKRLKRFEVAKTFTAKQLQSEIAYFNNELKSYYAKPEMGQSLKAKVYAGLVDAERKALDEAIASLVAPGYQILKNEYGAVREIQKSVATVAKRNAGKIDISYLDILSASGAIHGLAFANAELITAALLTEGIKRGVGELKNPNRIVRNVFEDVEKLQTRKAFIPKSRTYQFGEGQIGTREWLTGKIPITQGNK